MQPWPILQKTAPTAGLAAISFPFLAISVAAGITLAYFLVSFVVTRQCGREEKAVVYGYTEADWTINGKPALRMKLLIDTPEGKRFIFYDTKTTVRKYPINEVVRLRVFGKFFLLC